MSAPFSMPETFEPTATADDVMDQARLACDRIMAMAGMVVRLSYEGVTTGDLAKEGRRFADGRRNAMELALDDLRSVFVQALSGALPPDHGYANSTHLAEAVTARLSMNDEAVRIAATRAPARPCEICAADESGMRAAHARGAAMVAALPALALA
ncbi:hypothetical protein [Methylobacterium sp. Leaf108]|uniref:hypothetical protein n=1 Tax=Methylobacterium sp. Leaf108 TaxID=1736256 RepID=UPI0007018EC5|nr:hypothetical protein [Methylobacterium sp. Leaf108]KQP61090.1 hypothetical protein ASF39_15575 [Methylobacterium sp. Leaf108]